MKPTRFHEFSLVFLNKRVILYSRGLGGISFLTKAILSELPPHAWRHPQTRLLLSSLPNPC